MTAPSNTPTPLTVVPERLSTFIPAIVFIFKPTLTDVALGSPGRIYSMRVGPTKQGDTEGLILDSSNGTLVKTFNQSRSSRFYGYPLLATSPDRRLLFVGETFLSPVPLSVYDTVNDEMTLVREDDGSLGGLLRDMALSPDGKKLFIVCNFPQALQAVDASNLSVVGREGIGPVPVAVAASGDGGIVIAAKEDPYHLEFYSFDAASLQKRVTFSASGTPYRLGISPDGEHILAATWNETAMRSSLDVYMWTRQDAPLLEPLAPLPDSSVNSTAPVIRVRIDDPDGVDPVSVHVQVDWRRLAVTWDPATSTATANASGLPKGLRVAHVSARDLRGAVPSERMWFFSVDIQRPDVLVSSPVRGAALGPGPVEVRWQWNDGGLPIAGSRVLVDGRSAIEAGLATNATILLETPGPHEIRVQVTDLAGNIGEAWVDVTVNGPGQGISRAGPPAALVVAAAVVFTATSGAVAVILRRRARG